MESEHLKKLEELTPKLTDIISSGRQSDRHLDCMVEYETTGGTCIGFGMYFGKDMACQRAFMSTGTKMVKHIHSVTEILVVYRGKLHLMCQGDSVTVGVGEAFTIKPGLEHYVVALEDTWCLGITIPSEEGYPSAK